MADLSADVGIIGGGIAGAHLARLLASRGKHVVIIERGPPTIHGMHPPTPDVQCVSRVHGGVRNARNHVLGGNSHFWGGGLMRPDAQSVAEVLGVEGITDTEDLRPAFQRAEEAVGLRHTLKREPLRWETGVDVQRAEIAVLPGRARNIAAVALRAAAVDVRTDCEVVELAARDGRVTHVHFRQGNDMHALRAASVVLAAGALDSNLLLMRARTQLGVRAAIGTRLHDHFSVPLFRVRGGGSALAKMIAPTFEDGVVIGRHFEFSSETGWNARGFLHFQFYFDEVSPYRDIKRILTLRQQRASVTSILRAVASAVPQVGRLARIGYSRFVEHRLHLSEHLPIVATLDFETVPSPRNRIEFSPDGTVSFDWDVREEDVQSFRALLERAQRFTAAVAERTGVRLEPIADLSPGAAEAHLRASATDAYHLGGGLAAGRTDADAVSLDLRVQGTTNLYVLSTATFRRPGVANPTLALLALADRLSHQLQPS